jgi:hypothetical protein
MVRKDEVDTSAYHSSRVMLGDDHSATSTPVSSTIAMDRLARSSRENAAPSADSDRPQRKLKLDRSNFERRSNEGSPTRATASAARARRRTAGRIVLNTLANPCIVAGLGLWRSRLGNSVAAAALHSMLPRRVQAPRARYQRVAARPLAARRVPVVIQVLAALGVQAAAATRCAAMLLRVVVYEQRVGQRVRV